jgi:hypothetical protein
VAESLDVDEVYPVTTYSVSHQRSVLARRDPPELKATQFGMVE